MRKRRNGTVKANTDRCYLSQNDPAIQVESTKDPGNINIQSTVKPQERRGKPQYIEEDRCTWLKSAMSLKHFHKRSEDVGTEREQSSATEDASNSAFPEK